MVKRYIKNFLVIFSIFIYISRNYASLTASDGSMFLTKTEFDNAVANFNSRLATFETGINSKIDSQVTSYLDRNGIWSGKAQVLENEGNYSCGISQALGIPINSTKTVYFHNAAGASYKGYNSTSVANCLDLTSGTKSNGLTLGTLVSDISKPGLLNIMGTYGDGISNVVNLYRTIGNWNADGCMVLRLTWKLMKENASGTTCEWAKTWQWENTFVTAYWVEKNAVPVIISKHPLSAYIFVAKHDKIICQVQGDTMVKNATVSGLENLKMDFNIVSAIVY